MFICDAKMDWNENIGVVESRLEQLDNNYYFKLTRSVKVHVKHHHTCQKMKNMSYRFPPLVIRGYKLLIPLLCRGIIVLSSFLKRTQSVFCNSSTGTDHLTFYAFFCHLFKSASHLLLRFTCSAWASSLGQQTFSKHSLKSALGSDFNIEADLITH